MKHKDKKTEDIKEEEVKTEEVTEDITEDVAEEVPEVELLREKVAELEKEAAEAKDKMLRHQAELENYRKRLVREKEEAVKFANTHLMEELLQFLDNLERAEAAARQGGDAEALADGVNMTMSQLLSTLEKSWGLKQIESVGKEFDPELHEACMAVADESVEHETVVEEFQKGYMLHDRVIRPAKVKIARPC